MLAMIVVSFVVEIELKLLEQILQFNFQSLNIQQAAFVNLVITQTPNKLKLFSPTKSNLCYPPIFVVG